MTSVTADSSLLYDALASPRNDRTVVVAFVASLFLHAAAITLLPGMRAPQPLPKVITVELERTPPPDVPKKIPQQKPAPKLPKPKVEESFERQELPATPTPTAVPQPTRVDPRTDVAVAPRPEPVIERKPQLVEPAPVMRAEPRPLPEVQPMPQPRVDRARVVPEPQRPEPLVERRVEVRPEPELQTRVEPRLQAIEPRVAPRPEQRVEPVATPRAEPVLQPQRQQLTAAAVPPRLDAAPTPKMDAPMSVARIERQPEVKPEPRNEPAIPSPQRPVAEPARPPEQAAPRPDLLTERRPQPVAPAQREIRPEATQPPAPVTRAQARQELSRNDIAPVLAAPQLVPQPNVERRVEPRLVAPAEPAPLTRAQPRQEVSRNDIAPVLTAPQLVPQANAERRIEPRLTAPSEPAPEVRRQTKPTVEARATTTLQGAPAAVAPPEQPRPLTAPKISAPVVAAAMPAAPKRNKADEEEAIRRYASEVSRAIERAVSERDYPRLARDRRWQGTAHLVLRIHADGKLGEVKVATSSGYDILDQRALDIISKLKLPIVPAEVQTRAFSVRVPVSFMLRD